jgi:hypothetical protein
MNAREWSLRHAELLRAERGALADLLLSLAEFDRVAAYRELGYATFFDYLHRELRLSRGSAHYRQVATRLVVRFPEIEEPLRDGRLCLSTVIVVARVMTEANRHEVLPRFFGLSRQEAEQVAVEDPARRGGASEDGRDRGAGFEARGGSDGDGCTGWADTDGLEGILAFNGVQTGYIGNGQTGDMGNSPGPCPGHKPTR